MDNPKVSVIVPVYKVDEYLARCLESILHQTLEEIEIIIVDEGDQDRCRQIIDFYEQNYPNVIAPHKKNGGYGASVNLGIDMAKGEYIGIVESDDYIEPDMYEKMYLYAKELDADVVKTPYYECALDKNWKVIRRKVCSYRKMVTLQCPQRKTFSVKDFPTLMSVHASLWSGIYRTSYMREKNIQFIQAKGGAYVDVGFRIDSLINTDRVAWLDKVFYNYVTTNEGSTTNNFNLSAMLQRWKEAHEKFNERPEEDYDLVGPALLLDEYLNTLGWCNLIKPSADDVKQMKYNFSFVSEGAIEASVSLDKQQKEDLILFKKDPQTFMRICAYRRRVRKLRIPMQNILDKLSSRAFLFGSLKAIVASLFVNWLAGTGYLAWNWFWQPITQIVSLVFVVLSVVSIVGRIAHFIIKKRLRDYKMKHKD